MLRVRVHTSDHLLQCKQGGDLQQALSNDLTGELDWHRRGRNIALDISRGLTFLHATGVVHRCSVLLSAPQTPLDQPSEVSGPPLARNCCVREAGNKDFL